MPFPIKATSHQTSWELTAALAGPSLLEFLQNQEVPIRSSCMGKGTCHQCRVRVTKGVAPIANADRKFFSEDQLQKGWRLSCQLRPKAAIEVEFPQVYLMQEDLVKHRSPIGPWWVALDAGTTGLEMSAVDDQGPWCSLKAVNRQITMGADVMTRLEYAQKQGVEPLRKRLFQQLNRLVGLIGEEADGPAFTGKMFAAGNSVMASFLANLNVESLGVSPYQPANLEPPVAHTDKFEIHSLPLLHSFVGGDLWAGLFVLWQRGEMDKSGWILVDVGTNSEILFWTGKKLLVSSTPAGPAFEGSNISIGMRAEAGAILDPVYDPKTGSWEFSTIGGDMAKGICGSALIQMMDQIVQNGLVAEDGEVLRPEDLELQSDLQLSQADVREFQLAKSAIRSGLEMVIKVGALKPNRLLLAGAFGEHLPVEAAYRLGLLPRIDVTTLGNASLTGTIAWGSASDEDKQAFTEWVNRVKSPVELALMDEFQEVFIKHMSLSEGH
ncbi:MAG: DUF4445 domain-containing protein [Bdellovibrionaceae bacterium]|nr:DUF4445 domain-containing protein [Bdellovibrionales bacterium]MCB9084538.1 DUF4445 domain-containing protein [Pseudobdellovibrionaceae bacterium]